MSLIARFSLLALAAFLTCSTTAYSSTIYNNGSPNQADGLDISGFIAADDFTLGTSATVSGVIFYASANVDPFTSQFSGTIGYGLFTNDNGTPGTLMASGYDTNAVLSDTGNSIFGTEEYQIAISLPSIPISAGTYWLGLHEGAFGTPDDGTTIYWDTTSSQTGSLPMVTSDLSGSGGWYPGLSETTYDLAFALDGSTSNAQTPEPSTFAPVLLFSVSLIVLRKASTRRSENH